MFEWWAAVLCGGFWSCHGESGLDRVITHASSRAVNWPSGSAGC